MSENNTIDDSETFYQMPQNKHITEKYLLFKEIILFYQNKRPNTNI